MTSVVSAPATKPSDQLAAFLPGIEEQPFMAAASNNMLNLVIFVLYFITLLVFYQFIIFFRYSYDIYEIDLFGNLIS